MIEILEEERKEISSALAKFAKFHGVLTKDCRKKSYAISTSIGGEKVSYEIRKFDYLENIAERAIVGKDEKAVKSLVDVIRNGKNEWVLENIPYSRMGYNNRLLPFLKEYNEFIKRDLSNAPLETILHCDAYPTNVLVGGTIIDPKPLKRGNPMADISHFLISPKFDFINQQDSITAECLLDEYLKNLSKHISFDANKLKETYNAHVVHNSIGLMGAMLNQSKKNPKKKKDARYFFNKAIDMMEELELDDLKKSFISYIKNSEYAQEHKLLRKIGIDFDGVISDSTKLKIQKAKSNYSIDLQPEHCSKGNAEKEGLSKEDYERIVREIYGTDVFLSAEEMPEAKKTIERLIERGNEVYIVTSRGGEEAGFAEKWLANRGIPYTELVNTSEQSKLPVCKERGIEVFIDDTYEKLEELAGIGLQLYLFSNPVNRNIEIKHQDIQRAEDWKKIPRFL